MFYQLILPQKGGGKVSINYPKGFQFTTTADIINSALNYIFPIAGLILFFVFIMAGFNFLTAAGNEEKIKKAQTQITNAAIGFVIILVSFWLIKLIEYVFGIRIF